MSTNSSTKNYHGYDQNTCYRCSRNNQHYAQSFTIALFYMLVSTCFGSSLSSSGSFWIRLSYIKIQIDLVVYHIMLLSNLCAGV
jgi:hypothetical protein